MDNEDVKQLVFVCSPYSGDVKTNVENAKKFCHWISNVEGKIPFAPHLFFPQFLDDSNPIDRKTGIEGGLELLKACDEIYVFQPGLLITNGMHEEIDTADEYGKKITFIDKELVQEIIRNEV